MTGMDARIDAVIVCFNEEDDLRELMDAGELVRACDRVVVVDNGSTDGSAVLVRESGLELVRLDRNRGFAAAANIGVANTTAPTVALINPDVRLGAQAVAALARHIGSPDFGVVAPRLRLPDGSLQDSARTVPTPGTLVQRRLRGSRLGALAPSQAVEVPWLSSACMIIDRGAWNALGGFDDRFFLYFEDVDFGVRMRAAGYRVIIDPTVEVQHEHRAKSRRSLFGWSSRQHAKSAAKFYGRHPRYLFVTGRV